MLEVCSVVIVHLEVPTAYTEGAAVEPIPKSLLVVSVPVHNLGQLKAEVGTVPDVQEEVRHRALGSTEAFSGQCLLEIFGLIIFGETIELNEAADTVELFGEKTPLVIRVHWESFLGENCKKKHRWISLVLKLLYKLIQSKPFGFKRFHKPFEQCHPNGYHAVMTIGERIRKYRRLKDLTQAELAEQVGINKQNISRYESGKAEPRKSTLKKLADALEIGASELLGMTDSSNTGALKDPRLLSLLGEVEQLPDKDKEALIRLMNIVVREHRIQSAIAS